MNRINVRDRFRVNPRWVRGLGGPVVTPAVAPFLTALGTGWDGTNLPLNDTDSMTSGAGSPTVVGNALRFTNAEYLKFPLNRSVNGLTIAITVKATNAATQFDAVLGMVGATGGYLDIVAKTVGKFEARLRSSSMGLSLQATPYNGNIVPVTPDSFNQIATFVVRFQADRAIISVNDIAHSVAMLDGSVRNISDLRLGFGGQGYGAGMDFYRLDVLDSVDPYDIRAMTAAHAVFGPAQLYETPFFARKFVTLGDSIDSGIASESNNNGFAQQARAKFLTLDHWTNNDEPAIAAAQMSPYERAGAEQMNAAQIAGSFSNVVNTALIFTDAVGCLVGYGVNDYARDVPIGLPSDVTDQTFYGAMNLGLKKLSEYGLLTVGRTPFFYNTEGTANLAGHVLQDYRDAMTSNFDRWGVPYADLFTGLGINASNVFDFTTDGAHPNQAGHDLGAAPMIETMKTGGKVPTIPAGLTFGA